MKWLLVSALMLSACAFHGVNGVGTGSGADDDGSGDTTGSSNPVTTPVTGTTPTSPEDVVNIPAGSERPGTIDLTLGASGPVTIDTGALTISGVTLAAGDDFINLSCDGCSGELAVLHVKDLLIQGAVHVTGSRPLVIIASSVQTSAAIDVTAHGNTAGGRGNGDDNVLSSNRGGAIEIYGKDEVENSGTIVAGTVGNQGSPGAIVLQGGMIQNTGRMSANGADHPGPAGKDDDRDGDIVLLYKNIVSGGTTTPAPTTKQYQ